MEPLFLASMRRWHEDRSSKRLLGTINECEKCIRTFNLLCAFNCSVMSDSFATAWTAACQALLSMEFFRQEYWSGLPFPPPGDLPDAGIKRMCPESPKLADNSLPLSHLGSSNRRPSAKELMLSHCGAGKNSWAFLGLQGDKTSQS